MKEMTVEARGENVRVLTDWADAELERLECPLKAQMQIAVAIDELVGNIAKYAYNPGVGEATVRVEVIDAPLSVVITFIDGGIPFDPLAAVEPDTALSAEERALGGLGIFMVRKTMDEITYRYENGSNILSIRKTLRS